MSKQIKTVTVELPADFPIELGRGIGGVTVNVRNFDQAGLVAIFDYGLTQWVNDGGSSPQEGEEPRDGVMRRKAEFDAGNLPDGRRGPTQTPGQKQAAEWIESVLTERGRPGRLTVTKARALIKASLAEAYAVAMPDGDFDEFMAEADAFASRKAESNPLRK